MSPEQVEQKILNERFTEEQRFAYIINNKLVEIYNEKVVNKMKDILETFPTDLRKD